MSPPLIAHIVHTFDFGGLENGLVNLINLMPVTSARHVVIALTEATSIQERIVREDVRVYALGKRPGNDLACYLRLYELVRELKPDIVHTRNFGTLDCQLIAWLAGVKRRIHGEHGRDVSDPDGRVPKYRIIRKVLSPLLEAFVAVSAELETWLIRDVGIPAGKVRRICNGVDTERFAARMYLPDHVRHLTIGTVTRFSEIKDPLNTARAFVELNRIRNGVAKLLMVGDGPLRGEVSRLLEEAGLQDVACLPGSAIDVEPYLRQMDVFVLGSRREGISNTVLEAMASGLPVVATAVGGNLELVDDGVTGRLVPTQSPDAIAAALASYVDDRALIQRHGGAGRKRVEERFSIDAMVTQYSELYAGPISGRQ
jgi:sugar transferase (PEP-CTERM/EpsH1 system associated)